MTAHHHHSVPLALAAAALLASPAAARADAGDACFFRSEPLGQISPAYWAAAGDFDGDGDTDLVTSGPMNPINMAVHANDGQGVFAVPDAFDTAGQSVYAGAVADMDLDGDLDVVLLSSLTFTIMLNDGAGSFTASPEYGVGGLDFIPYDPWTSLAVAVADLDGDQDPDIAVSVVGSSNLVAIHRNEGGGVFTHDANYDAAVGGHQFRTNIAAVDLDNDFDNDLVVLRFDGGFFVLENNPEIGFAAPVAYAEGTSFSAIVVADFDDDHAVDVAGVTDEGIALVPGYGDRTFGAAVSYATGADTAQLTAADLNQDALPDLAVIVGGSDDHVAVLYSQGDGTLSAPEIYELDRELLVSAAPAAGDLDGDRDIDLAVITLDSEFAPSPWSLTMLRRVCAGCPGDVDGSGDVGFADLMEMLVSIGDCPEDGACPFDLDGSGGVDFGDVIRFFAAWGPCR